MEQVGCHCIPSLSSSLKYPAPFKLVLVGFGVGSCKYLFKKSIILNLVLAPHAICRLKSRAGS